MAINFSLFNQINGLKNKAIKEIPFLILHRPLGW